MQRAVGTASGAGRAARDERTEAERPPHHPGAEGAQVSGGVKLNALLITPVQRVPRSEGKYFTPSIIL